LFNREDGPDTVTTASPYLQRRLARTVDREEVRMPGQARRVARASGRGALDDVLPRLRQRQGSLLLEVAVQPELAPRP